VLVSFITGTPILVGLVVWGIWHARRAFGVAQPAPAYARRGRSSP
jgi:hypothetical protein